MNHHCRKVESRSMVAYRMTVICTVVVLLTSFTLVSYSSAQDKGNSVKIFGYFQNSFSHWTAFDNQPKQNAFNLHQLNLLFQKDLDPDWTAFINFEFLNNFSSGRRWGSAKIEEAWVKYRANRNFNLKLGMLIPIFNNLNEIKNRTPLLPYITRPLAYETSFGEIINIDVFIPVQGYTQIYGFVSAGEAKIDYAVYLGNTPNINNQPSIGQTGVDTTTSILIGGRVG